MAKRENVLPYAPIGKLIQDATGKRVSRDAKISAAELLENLTKKLIHKANLLAEHSGRKTVRAKDLNLAFQQIKGEL